MLSNNAPVRERTSWTIELKDGDSAYALDVTEKVVVLTGKPITQKQLKDLEAKVISLGASGLIYITK